MAAPLKPLSLVHRYRPERRPVPGDGSSTHLLILLHGLGSNEDDLFGLAPYFDPRFTILSVRAPNPYGNGGYAWFDLGITERGMSIDFESTENGRQAVLTFVREAQVAYGAAPERTLLGGFSQGAIMSASLLLTEPALVAGAVLMSGFVLPDLPVAAPEALAGKPVLITHGEYDNVIPVDFARESRAGLEALGLAVTYHEYPMAHQLSEDCIQDVDDWLVKRIGSAQE
jgi:phospholipase/carboxylesterase